MFMSLKLKQPRLSFREASDQDPAAAAAAALTPLEWLEHRVTDEKQQFRLQPRVPLQPPGSLISQHQQLLPQNTSPLRSSASLWRTREWVEREWSQKRGL